jgi:lipopolysaccharide transport system ATP-binding protein
MSDVVLSVERVSKRYRLGAKPHPATLREALAAVGAAALRAPARCLAGVLPRSERAGAAAAADSGEFWALRDVSFEVRRGEVLGIMGRNGAGKSTLLKILARITEPTHGRVGWRGRVGSLLEVGTGFHPDLTGRENIFLNGRILGLSRREVRRRFDQIVAFAEVERFLDTPVKHYSSGMYVRLGFAVAAHVETDILIVDEVLAVGDAAFQRKCQAAIAQAAHGGRTVLFVSHNPTVTAATCTRCLIMEDGSVGRVGAAAELVPAYLRSLTPRPPGGVVFAADARRHSQFRRVGLQTAAGRPADDFDADEEIRIEVCYSVGQAAADLVLVAHLFNEAGVRVLSSRLRQSSADDGHPFGVGDHAFRLTVPPRLLAAGNYTITVRSFLEDGPEIERHVHCCGFSVTDRSGGWQAPGAVLGIPLPWIAVRDGG